MASFNDSNLTGRAVSSTAFPPHEVAVLPLTLYGIMSFAIMVANSLVIFLVWRRAELRSVSNSFLTSLAVSDFLTGSLAIPLVITCSTTLLENLCIGMDLCNRFLAFSSVGHLTVLSIDRYLRIVRSLQYRSQVTERRAAIVIGSVWSFALLASGIQLFWIKLVKTEDTLIRIEMAYNFFCLAFVVIIPLVIMSTIYIRIFRKLTVRTPHVGIEMSVINGGRQIRRGANEKKVALLFMAMIAVFISGLVLYFLCAILIDLENIGHNLIPPEHINSIVEYVLFFRFFTALGNPLLCAFFKKDFHGALKQLILCH